MQKGQYIRLLIGGPGSAPNSYIGAAKDMQLHLSAQTEESTTKDTTGDAQEFEITGQSYDITGSSLVLTPDDALLGPGIAVSVNDFINWIKGQTLVWRICLVEGENNRTIVEEICSGQAKLTNLQVSAQNKQNVTYNYTLNGYGPITPHTT